MEIVVDNEKKDTKTAAFDSGVRMQLKPIGASGTDLNGGYFAEEYLTKLRGRRGAKTFDEMRRSEAQVSMLLNAIMNPIKSASWEVEAAADVNDGEAHAQFIDFNRIDCIDWETHLNEALSFISFGFSLFESVHNVIYNHEKFGTRNVLKSLAFRSQKTIERWIVSDDTGQLQAVEQWVMGDYIKSQAATRVMDAQHLVVFTLNKEGDNYEGISALRPMYGAYFRKNLYLKILAMGLEQNAKGTVVGTVPGGLDEDDKELAEFKKVLGNFVAHESAFITVPEGWTVDIKSNEFDASKVKDVIVFENTEMINAVVANFLALGTNGGGGAFALSNDLSDFMLNGIKNYANIICGVWNRVIIPNLIKLNYGPQKAYPKLKVSGIDDKAGKELAEILASLVGQKVIKPDDKLEESLRKRYNLPPADPTTARETQPTPAPQFNPQLSEARLQLAEGYKTAWADNKAKLKTVMQDNLKTLLDNKLNELKNKWAKSTTAAKPSLALSLSTSGLNDYKRELREELARLAQWGINDAAKATPWVKTKLTESIKLAAPKGGYYEALPANIKRLILAQANLIGESQLNDIQKLVSFQYGQSMAQENIDQIILDIQAAVLPTLEGSTAKGLSLDAAAGNAVSTAIQQARMEFFFDPEVWDTIESFTFTNADPVSEICQELNGLTVAANDPLLDTYSTPLHHNCKSYWVPNEKGVKGNPDITRGGVSISQKGLDSITLSESCACPGHVYGLNHELAELSPEDQKLVSAKIAKLIGEGYDQTQAAAIAYSMLEKGEL